MIQAKDAKLLMLVEVDCRNGEPGSGARGGEGGRGGVGGCRGYGGAGGASEERDVYLKHQWNRQYDEKVDSYKIHAGKPGKDGRDGADGRAGKHGRDSRKGQKAECGNMLWVVYSDNDLPQESPTRYDAKVENYNVVPALNDGLFEPNERITVSGIVVHNTGGLALPGGALAVPSTQTVKFEPSCFEIPYQVLQPSQRYVIPFEFHGRICDLPPPNKPGRCSLKAEFHTRIEVLGRPFEKSFLKWEMVVQYPVQLGSLLCEENMGKGEISALSIEVNNISRLPYGKCDGSGGRVVLHLHLDARIIPLGTISTGSTPPYVITYDPSIQDSMYIELMEIPPMQKVTISFMIQMESCAELFERCFWQADLYLREKLIEYNHQCIRVSPKYNPHSDPADVLLVTSEAITRKEFVLWQHLLEVLNVSVDFWDTARHFGLSIDSRTGTRHENSWQGRYTGKMILYPHCNLQLLLGIDIAMHFHGQGFGEGGLRELGSSMVVFMPHSEQDENAMLKRLAAVNASVDICENAYGGRHLFRPRYDSPIFKVGEEVCQENGEDKSFTSTCSLGTTG